VLWHDRRKDHAVTTPSGRWAEFRLPDGRVRQDWIPDAQPPGPDGGPGVWHIVTDVPGQQGRWEWHPGRPVPATPPAFGPPAGFGAPPAFGPPADGFGSASFKAAVPKKSNKRGWIIAGVVVGVLAIIGGIGSALDDKPSETAAQATDNSPAGATPAKTTNQFGVEGAVSEGTALGELSIKFPIHDGLTAGTIRDGAARDVFTILEAVRGRSFKTVQIVGTIDVEDKYGQVQPDTEVMWVTFTRETVLRLNTANLDRGSLSTLEGLSCNFGMNPYMGYELHNTEDGPCYT
jgi:hypothetical protein